MRTSCSGWRLVDGSSDDRNRAPSYRIKGEKEFTCSATLG